MRTLAVLVLWAVSLTTVLHAQTTGVPGINDYTINGAGSGTTSCTAIPVGGSIVSKFRVSTKPGATVLFLFSPCPCSPGAMCVKSPSCTLLPMTACGGLSNQSLDLLPACLMPAVVDVANALGHAELKFFILYGIKFSTQAFVLDTTGGGCASPVFPGTFTQAYDVYTVPV